jgi:hypothetical protein
MKCPQYDLLRFDRNETVPFQWDPANPFPGLWGCVVSLLAVCWEKYVIVGFHDALDSVENPHLRVAQDGRHARLSRKLASSVFSCSVVAIALLAWVCRPRSEMDHQHVSAGRAERSCGEL